MNRATTTKIHKTRNCKKRSSSACKSLIAASYVLRLKCNRKDDGIVIASLCGLLDGRNKRDIMYIIWSDGRFIFGGGREFT